MAIVKLAQRSQPHRPPLSPSRGLFPCDAPPTNSGQPLPPLRSHGTEYTLNSFSFGVVTNCGLTSIEVEMPSNPLSRAVIRLLPCYQNNLKCCIGIHLLAHPMHLRLLAHQTLTRDERRMPPSCSLPPTH